MAHQRQQSTGSAFQFHYTTTPGHSGPGNNDNERLLHIPQSNRTEASPSDCLMSYPGHSFVESYPSAEMQSVYSTAPVEWATRGRLSPLQRCSRCIVQSQPTGVDQKKSWIQGCGKRNHAYGSSKHAWICLTCKMRSERERNGQLGRSNSYPSNRESCLISGLPTCWFPCKLPHCAIDTDVAFRYDYLSLAWMHRGERRHFETWWRTTRHELGCRTAKEDCCRQKRIHRKKLWELSFSA